MLSAPLLLVQPGDHSPVPIDQFVKTQAADRIEAEIADAAEGQLVG